MFVCILQNSAQKPIVHKTGTWVETPTGSVDSGLFQL